MAVLSHFSVLFGLPVFAVPLFRRRTPLALHHAKAACIAFLLFYICLALSMVFPTVLFPIAILLYIPPIVGIGRAAAGRRAGRWGFGHLGERIFGSLDLRDPEEPTRDP